jgi:heat-inducible transcriptional repressor
VVLTPRQELILRKLVEAHTATGEPVGSKTLAADPDLDFGASTIRNELAMLEEHGLLKHPHTSAGRVPTDAGHRFYVDRLLGSQDVIPRERGLDLQLVRREVDEAMRATTETLSQVTNLLAIVSAPPIDTATIRHVEVLLLQPQVLMVVVITSTGGVAKRALSFDKPIDPGLAKWAGEYLNERVSGLRLGTSRLRREFEEPSLSAGERGFLAALKPAFTEVLQAEQRLYVGGTEGLLADLRDGEVGFYRQVLVTLEKRAALLEILGEALDPRRAFVRVGGELEHPGFQDAALVAASYGLTNRALGAVGLLGPVRMDYEKALRSVRGAAQELSRFVEDVYEDN